MKHRVSVTIVAAAAAIVFCAGAASADALRCSNEAQACATLCQKVLNPLSKRTCLTNCSQRKALCLRTGCWNNGVRSYCNLLRK